MGKSMQNVVHFEANVNSSQRAIHRVKKSVYVHIAVRDVS